MCNGIFDHFVEIRPAITLIAINKNGINIKPIGIRPQFFYTVTNLSPYMRIWIKNQKNRKKVVPIYMPKQCYTRVFNISLKCLNLRNKFMTDSGFTIMIALYVSQL